MKTIETTYSTSVNPGVAHTRLGSRLNNWLLASRPGLEPVLLRIGLAAVLFPHGAQKLLGWFGGYGFSGTMGFLTQTMGLPSLVAAMVIAIEFFAPLMLLAGLATRVASISLGGVMLGAMFMAQVQHGFFMNWSGTQAGEGIQFTLLFLAASAALFLRGAGSFSLDSLISAKLESQTGKRD